MRGGDFVGRRGQGGGWSSQCLSGFGSFGTHKKRCSVVSERLPGTSKRETLPRAAGPCPGVPAFEGTLECWGSRGLRDGGVG